ncbi:uncharacterized protein LOC131234496 isoform X2 [Magnolia sinica]|uniref:uncharacterized protein LOC131234496 isoform X2 n=1 Tax=Magnolia sinica TaxID=86752 RepID=UPI00265B6312|nr:uncharacterized protein LOC131234496 isoform X2 [Magnolia sinica]
MRRRFVKSQTPRVRVRKLFESESEEEKIATSRVRVFPSMPSVGTRRSTRVFVPKSVAKAVDADVAAPARVLRSGKLLRPVFVAGKPAGEGDSDDDWLRWLKQEGFGAINGRDDSMVECDRTGSDSRDGSAVAVMETAEDLNRRMFGIVYSRKRRRLAAGIAGADAASAGLKDRMYGIPFVRKQRRKTVKTAGANSENLQECRVVENINSSLPPKGKVIVVFVESSWSSSHRFRLFLLSVLGWMRQCRMRLSDFCHFLLSDPMAGAFTQCGIRFCSVDNMSSENCFSCSNSCGVCIIFGARQFTPLVSLNCAALPSYFMSLHSSMMLRSHFLPNFLERFLMGLLDNARGDTIGCKEHNSCISTASGVTRREIMSSGIPAAKRSVMDCFGQGTENASRNLATQHNLEFRKHQRRRTSLRSARVPKYPLDWQNEILRSEPYGARKLNLATRDSVLGPGRGKSLDACLSEFFSVRDEYAVFSSPRAKQGQKKLRNIPSEKIKELKSALVDLKQNIDSVRCSTNILVIESDRCWRENGAEVMLEYSGSKEWMLAVKIRGLTRYLHKAQEMRPSTVNRYTHAMMWTGENGWKLEFCDRIGWLVFKELHRECCERNMQAASVRIIPVPGVQEVSGYGDRESVPFVRPDAYISMGSDEVERALMSKNARYDMDSEDEEWLKQLNYNFHDSENGNVSYISEDDFEKIIFSLEKAAYNNPDDVSDKNRAISHFPDLGRRDMVASIYDYWLRKRKQKRSSLVRVFQGPPPKRTELIQRPSFRKKRSFKRQASQVGRGEPPSFLQASPCWHVYARSGLIILWASLHFHCCTKIKPI